jgi:ribosomal protein S18 acetylase RimI-like enzyme
VTTPVEIVQLTRDECHRVLDSLIAISAEEDGFAWTSEQLLHDMPDKWTLSAIARDAQRRVVGYQVTSRAPGHPHLHRIMVAADWRSAGIGALLMAWLCRACMERNWAPLTFKVHATNHRAVQFYQRLGFAMHDIGKIDALLNARLLEGRGEPAEVLRVLERLELTG